MASYHLHVYFDQSEIDLAATVRAELVSSLHGLTYLGQLIDKPIGPHPLPMFELHLPESELKTAIPIIDAKRRGLSVLVHPVTGDQVIAHTSAARWLGRALSLNLEILRKHRV